MARTLLTRGRAAYLPFHSSIAALLLILCAGKLFCTMAVSFAWCSHFYRPRNQASNVSTPRVLQQA